MTRAEAAEYLDTTPATLSTWACTGNRKIPTIRIGRNVRYKKEDLDKYIAKNTVNGIE